MGQMADAANATQRSTRNTQYAPRFTQLQYSRGSVIFPVMALAATVAGDARNTCDSLWPIRPGKFRLVALMHFIGEFIRPNVSTGPPRQAAQPAFSVICTPESTRICQTVFSPHFAVCRSLTISGVAGTPKVSIFTRLPFRTRANSRKSLVLPPVHEPMYA